MKKLLVTFLFCYSAFAIVYDTREGISVDTINRIVRSKNILSEKIKVNGESGKLTVDVSELPIDDILNSLSKILKNFKHAKNSRSVLINIPDKGFVYRYYIMSAGFEYKTVIFKIRVPDAAFKEDPSKYWPKNLPKPHGKITQVIALKDKAIWALYETESYADQAF
ncbi:MAG: hypothetical protein HRT89_20205, partial [Lentisphaeria bacterium]|nr:hypothetical protein [Lentisphaeria bacterium]NQZ70383.1 hypothetical protein [Lentisphaeria bacterium]